MGGLDSGSVPSFPCSARLLDVGPALLLAHPAPLLARCSDQLAQRPGVLVLPELAQEVDEGLDTNTPPVPVAYRHLRPDPTWATPPSRGFALPVAKVFPFPATTAIPLLTPPSCHFSVSSYNFRFRCDLHFVQGFSEVGYYRNGAQSTMIFT